LVGLKGEALKEITEVARIEDRNHFEALVPRIYELGGHLPDNFITFHFLNFNTFNYFFMPSKGYKSGLA